jgi:hypothetical protein
MHVRKLLGVAVAALLVMTAAPANAHLQERDDPQGDVAGGKLDIKRVGLGHSDTRFSVQMLMWENFRARSLGGGPVPGSSRAITWAFDSKGGPALDYGINLTYRNGELIAYLLRATEEGFVRAGNIDDVSKDGAFVKVSIRQSRMETRGGYVRWAGQTIWNDNGPCQATCQDSRPEQTGKNPTLINHNL